MSMNLACDEMDLWQTPTWVTNICYSNGDGGWQGIRYRYEQWARSTLNGKWNSIDDLEDHRAIVEDHIKSLRRHKSLNFYIV